ncbi:hypothetical protein ACQ4PT_005334 [Festuca glaucescens]
MAVPATDMDGMANGIVDSSAESPPVQASPEPRTKGRRLRRWHRIQRKHQREESPSAAVAGGGGANDEEAQLRSRRAAKREARGRRGGGELHRLRLVSRFVPLEPKPGKLDPDLGLVITSIGFSVGAGGGDSDNSEDRGSKSSTAASDPRYDFARQRDRSRAHTAASLHGKNHRTARARGDMPLAHAAFSPAEAENSRSASVESDRQSSNTINGLKPEIQNSVVARKESTDDFDAHDDGWSDLLHLEEPVEEARGKGKDLESKLEQASTLINEKDSRILELEALSRTRAWRCAIQSINSLLLQPDFDQLILEKMEAEIQCIILTRASQTRTPLPLAEDRKALYEEQKCLLSDYKQLELKLCRSENRAAILGGMVEKLEAQAKELSASSEILQLQSRASTLSVFCFIQFILLLITIGIVLIRLLPLSTGFVPT